MEGPGSIIPQIVLIVILTGINAFFASAEMAFVSLNSNKLRQMEEDGNKKAIAIGKLMQDQTKFLSTIQVCITLAGFFASATAASNLASRWAPTLTEMGVPYASAIATLVVTLMISYISLVFGELVPKRIALQNSEKVAMASVGVINVALFLFTPFVKLLSFSTTIVLKLLGQYSEDIEEMVSEEEIKSLINVGQEQGVINIAGKDMIISIFDFDDKLAYEIMTPRTSIYMVDYDEFNLDTINEILEVGFSRVPVYKDSTDNIIGIINIKDVFVELSKNDFGEVKIDNVLKPPYFVPESKNIDHLLKELQDNKNYVALLIDEYGGFSGMVTVEDIVEEIVGEIEDEYDIEVEDIKKVDTHSYIIRGSMSLDDINDEIDTELISENHETLSGMIIELLGYIPDESKMKSEEIKYNNYIFRILELKDKRIEKVLLKILPKVEEETEEK